MNIIVGATGQIGSHILKELDKTGIPARAVIRDQRKLSDKNRDFREADLFNIEEVKRAFAGGETAFLLTPEDPGSHDPIGDAEKIVANYRTAILATGIQKIVGLSSIGAHLPGNTGNLAMSRILEQGFKDLPIATIFIRPSYYYSNWLAYIETVQQYNILPTFFPAELTLDMNAPEDVANFIARVITGQVFTGIQEIFELTGPVKYSSSDVAKTLSNKLGKEIQPQPIAKENWLETLLSAGFTKSAAYSLIEMTQAVVDGKALPEVPAKVVKLSTKLQEYFEKQPGFAPSPAL
ncbi:NmrA family NAD(P)-binding protein [Desertivirga brevis]|uniref:NmrA family NAD(P)-binding protein n=1 Tax=Desertivirga brevis TaxID=2810310 RepID=UPI001A9632B4|nr:NAD(P)H-binding protein [Pedobacter sp. SYSU D00873]